jgi:hypothetical protein
VVDLLTNIKAVAVIAAVAARIAVVISGMLEVVENV